MNEINFLVDLILNHKLPLATKKVVAERLKLVSEQAAPVPMATRVPAPAVLPPQTAQAPSTLANLAKHGLAPPPPPVIEPPVEPVAVIAQTPAAVAAMQSRAAAISASMDGKVDKVTGRPRKF